MLLSLLLALSQASVAIPPNDHFDAAAELQTEHFASLETHFAAMQSAFERGSVSENELIDAYTVFYPQRAEKSDKLDKWVRQYPKSYYSHLVLGIYDAKLAELLRGSDYTSQTPDSQLAAMDHWQTTAANELLLSLKLNPRPYLSILHLLNIANWQGDDKAAADYVAMGNRLFPKNIRIRVRYLIHLEPRWGGSYPAMDAFIKHSKTEGADSKILSGLEAIKYQDLGCVAWNADDLTTARAQFKRALELGSIAGADFSEHSLQCAQSFMSENK